MTRKTEVMASLSSFFILATFSSKKYFGLIIESAFMYYYNPREGTPAATFPDQIDLKIKKERLQKIINLQLKHTTEVMEKRIGETITVLADIVSRDDERELLGKTEQNERVAFKADKNLIGSFVKVRLTALNGNTFKGELVQ